MNHKFGDSVSLLFVDTKIQSNGRSIYLQILLAPVQLLEALPYIIR